MCKDKDRGGSGFKDTEMFNQALLAKQAWRLWKSPNSLLSRLLKARYFRRSEFLDCGLGTRPSYAWRSILHGRELLKEGQVHKLDDGRGTKVWLDNWILGPNARPPRYCQDAVVDLTLTVHDLIDEPTRTWNVNLMRQILPKKTSS